MTQQITVACQLGPAYSASTISFKIFSIDGTQYANWTSADFSQIGTTGTFLKANVSVPDAGGYIQFSADGGSTVLSAVADIPALGALATAASIAALNNLSAQQVWEYVTRTLTASSDPTAAAIVAQILATTIEGRSIQNILLDVWAQVVGDFSADDADEPGTITYDGPDGTTQITHTLTDTTRSWS